MYDDDDILSPDIPVKKSWPRKKQPPKKQKLEGPVVDSPPASVLEQEQEPRRFGASYDDDLFAPFFIDYGDDDDFEDDEWLYN